MGAMSTHADGADFHETTRVCGRRGAIDTAVAGGAFIGRGLYATVHVQSGRDEVLLGVDDLAVASRAAL